jgi:hypothetical protein
MNSCTFTPKRRAAAKCPPSCITTSRENVITPQNTARSPSFMNGDSSLNLGESIGCTHTVVQTMSHRAGARARDYIVPKN